MIINIRNPFINKYKFNHILFLIYFSLNDYILISYFILLLNKLKSFMEQLFDVAVLGAGINGLSTSFHLSNVPELKLLVIEQFKIGHTSGSSHSNTRIIRTIYQNQIYLKLAQEAVNISWPQLQQKLNEKLIYENNCLVFGQTAQFEQYKKNILKANIPCLKILSGVQAQKINPSLKLSQYKQVLIDYSAGVIYAEKTIHSIHKYILNQGVTIKQQTQIISIIQKQNHIILKSSNGVEFRAKKVIITAGRWVANLVPQVSDILKVIQQNVSYLEFDDDLSNYEIGKYGCFIWYYKQFVYYSLPAFKDDKVKVGVNPIQIVNQLTQQEQISNVKNVYDKIFNKKLKCIQKVEKCYFTCTKSQQFIIDFIDPKSRILFTSICSGHAFKFGPLMGKILSQLIQFQKSSVKAFQDNKYSFSIQHQKEINKK